MDGQRWMDGHPRHGIRSADTVKQSYKLTKLISSLLILCPHQQFMHHQTSLGTGEECVLVLDNEPDYEDKQRNNEYQQR